MTDPTAIDKATLLANMESGWQELLTYVATLTPEQQTIPTDAAGWSVKDHLIHLAVWQDGVLAMLEGGSRPETMGVPQPVWETRDFDQINAVIFRLHRDKDLAQVLQVLHATQERFTTKVASMSEADYQRPNPDSPAGTRMIEYIVSDSYDHYAAHIPWMQAIVAAYVTTKAELLAAIHHNWTELHIWLSTLTEQQLTQPTDAAGWTVKDHVAHLWAWEDSMNAFLQRQSRPDYMQIPAELWGDDFDPLNAVIQQRYKDLPWSEVQQRFKASHEQLLARLEALSDADLQLPYNHYQPGEEYTSPAINSLAGNTFHHYAEHLPWMQAIAGAST